MKKPPLFCQLFGHRATGYRGGTPYGSIERGGVDGMETQHCPVRLRCDRCDERFTVAFVHMPAHFDPKAPTPKP